MPKVTIETPSEAVIKAANEVATVSAGGKTFGLRRPEFDAEFDIVLAVGTETAANTTYMNMVNPLLWVAEIDGEPVPLPRSEMHVKALIKRVGREGYLAVLDWLTARGKAEQESAEARIKNAGGTPSTATGSGS